MFRIKLFNIINIVQFLFKGKIPVDPHEFAG